MAMNHRNPAAVAADHRKLEFLDLLLYCRASVMARFSDAPSSVRQALYPGDRATDETLNCDCGKGGSTHKGRVLRHDGAADPGRFLIAAARARRCPRCAAAAAGGGAAAAAAAVPCLTFSLL
eukprot:gene25084-biopygen19475